MPDRIAVIGLGIAGIAALKNLREEGFDAIGFDKNEYIGGLWRWTANQETTSVTKKTRANISKQRMTFTDFPWPVEPDTYPRAEEIVDYLEQYAQRFELIPHCRLGVNIREIRLSEHGWQLSVKSRDGEHAEIFERVVVTTGSQGEPLMPSFPGQAAFKGDIIHSRAYKENKPFSGQRVIVVGASNTALDVAVELSEVATVFLSHRNGVYLVTRNFAKPGDHLATRRGTMLAQTVSRRFPSFWSWLSSTLLQLKMRSEHNLQPEWRLLPPGGPVGNVGPTQNDNIVPRLESGHIKSCHAVASFDDRAVVLTDGSRLEDIDTVILCTGYTFAYDCLEAEANPFQVATPEWDAHPHSNGLPFPWLYRGIFSTKYPESLAFMGVYRGHSISATVNADLASMAIAQIWKGNYSLPSTNEMNRFCKVNYLHALKTIKPSRTQQISNPNAGDFEAWLNDAAGTGVNERLRGGWSSWTWTFRNWKLARLLLDGIDTPFVYRMFDSPRGHRGRRKYKDALEAIQHANASASEPKGSI